MSFIPQIFYPANMICWGMFILWLTASGCSFFKPPIALQIGNQQWTKQQLTILLTQKIKDSALQNHLNEKTMKNIKQQLITDLLIKHIVTQWAAKQRIVISQEKLNAQIEKARQGYSHPSAFKMYLNRKQIKSADWKESIKYNLLVKEVMKHISADIVPPDEKELKFFYQKHLNDFKKKSRIQIRHIFHSQKAPLSRVLQLLKEGQKFKTLARQFSKAPELDKSQWVEKGLFEIFDQAFTLKKKQVSPIWRSSHGWHIVQVLDKQPGKALSFEEAKPVITATLMHRRRKAHFVKWLDTEGKKTLVFKNQEMINKINIL